MQQQFFNLLKNSLPSHVSMADELALKMGLSHDSIYRRIRGEKPLSMSELKQLCRLYNISMDQVLELQTNTVVFNAGDINIEDLPFGDYLRNMLAQLKYYNSFKKRSIRYICKDMTFFHFFHFPEIAAFKTFFWIKTIQNESAYGKSLFSLDKHAFEDCFALGQQVIREYNIMPSIELWNVESLNSTISQIEYYRDAGIFENRKDMLRVIDSLEATLDHLQMQAQMGLKFSPGDPETIHRSSIQLYINEVILGSNTILFEWDDLKESFITYSVLNYMSTRDPRFCKKVFSSFDNILARSTIISVSGERDRNKFFQRIKERVNELRG